MRRLKNSLIGLGLFYLCSSAFISGSLQAHPVALGNYDRTIEVYLTPENVIVRYRLEVSEATAVKDLLEVARSEANRLTRQREFHEAFTRVYAPIFAANLIAKLGGKELEFTCIRHGHEVLDHLRCDFVFQAPLKVQPGRRHEFTFREGNYEHEAGLIRLYLENEPSTPFTHRDAPDEVLLAKPFAEWKPGDEKRLRTAAATFEIVSLPPKSEPSAVAAESFALHKPATDDEPKGWFKAESAPEVATVRSGPPAEETAASHHDDSLLRLFLHSEQGFWMMLLVATGLGAAHALTPGHGKTLVAAYLVGQRGTVWHALLLGIVTTLTHTGIVLLLAGALWWYFPRGMTPETQRNVDTALGLIGGLLIAGLGVWLLLRRLSGQADHFHLPGQGHHHHHHGHTHTHALPQGGGVGGLIVLGVHGGIVPCWDAVVVLLAAVAMNLLWLALPMLLAFSAGLAGVLILIGVLVVKARGLAGDRWGDSRLFRVLPLLSALAITGLGLWLCFDRVRGRP